MNAEMLGALVARRVKEASALTGGLTGAALGGLLGGGYGALTATDDDPASQRALRFGLGGAGLGGLAGGIGGQMYANATEAAAQAAQAAAQTAKAQRLAATQSRVGDAIEATRQGLSSIVDAGAAAKKKMQDRQDGLLAAGKSFISDTKDKLNSAWAKTKEQSQTRTDLAAMAKHPYVGAASDAYDQAKSLLADAQKTYAQDPRKTALPSLQGLSRNLEHAERALEQARDVYRSYEGNIPEDMYVQQLGLPPDYRHTKVTGPASQEFSSSFAPHLTDSMPISSRGFSQLIPVLGSGVNQISAEPSGFGRFADPAKRKLFGATEAEPAVPLMYTDAATVRRHPELSKFVRQQAGFSGDFDANVDAALQRGAEHPVGNETRPATLLSQPSGSFFGR